MSQFGKTEKAIRYAGYSIHGNGEFCFHHSAGENNKFIVYADLLDQPMTTVKYVIYKLPRVMTKIAALQWLMATKRLEGGVREYFEMKLENMLHAPVTVQYITAAARRGRNGNGNGIRLRKAA